MCLSLIPFACTGQKFTCTDKVTVQRLHLASLNDSRKIESWASQPNLEQFNSVHVELYLNVTSIRFIDFLNVGGHLSKQCLLNPPLHDAGILGVRVHIKVGGDDRGAD